MKHILLTGRPRTGKTTLLKKMLEELKSPSGGFYTEEIRKDGRRIGFGIKTLGGKEGILAMEDFKSIFRVGKYGINLEDLETIGIKAIEDAIKTKDIVVIDEIGRMELFSQKFKDAVSKALDSGKRVIGVIHVQETKFLNDIRSRKDVVIFEVSLDNHEEILRRVSKEIASSP